MSICSACGGVLGRDCFNEQDCLMVSQMMDQDQDRQLYDELQSKDSEIAELKQGVADMIETYDRLDAVYDKRKAENARLREAVKVMRETVGDLVDALAVDRNRIEYLGTLSTNKKHDQANEEVFLPVIDEALSAADEILGGKDGR